MDNMEYKSNSNRSKEKANDELEPKRTQKIVTGKVRTKQRNKFTNGEVADNARHVTSYLITDVLIPAGKSMVADFVTKGINMVLYGTDRGNTRRSPAENISYTNYSRPSSSYSRGYTRSSSYNFLDPILDSRGEAEEVLDRLYEILQRYGVVRVADLYDLVGITGQYTDNRYGWTDLGRAEILPERSGGYILRMPRAIPID